MILGLIFVVAILALIGSYVMFYLRLNPPEKFSDNAFIQSPTFLWIAGLTNVISVVLIAPLAFYFGGRSKVASMAF